MLSSIAQEESRSISENVKWGLNRSRKAGKVSVAWSTFLGYEKGPDGLPRIVEEQAVIVRRIYNRFLEGASLNTIAGELTRDGVPTPTGKEKWRPEVIRSILKNEKFKGDARLQKTYVKDFLTKEVCVNRGERKQWYIHDSHDAIISPETFELVQKELERRCGRGGRFYDSPFTNKIFCGDCGAPYGHRVWDSNNKYRRNIWRCIDKYRGDSVCTPSHVTDRDLEKAFVIVVNLLLEHKAEFYEDYEREFIPMIGDTRMLDERLSAMTAELNDLIQEIENLVSDNARRAQDQTEYQEKFQTLNDAIVEKKATIEAVKQQISETLNRRENVRIFLAGLSLYDSQVTEFDIKAWHALVDTVDVMPDRTLVFHLRNGTAKAVSLEDVR